MTQNDCNCFDPSLPSGCVPLNAPFDCKIFMYFGEYVDTSTPTAIGILDEIYIADHFLTDGSWYIPDYHIDELIDSGILPDGLYTSSGSPNSHKKFILSEKELLSTATFETWMIWLSDYLTVQGPTIDDSSPLGLRVCKILKINIDDWYKESLHYVMAMTGYANTDPAGIFGNKFNLVPMDLTLTQEDRNLAFIKLEHCYNWLKNIYDTYYGKKYFVKIGNPSPIQDVTGNFNFRGICAKEEDGSYPQIGIPTGKYYVQGDGSGQKIFLSDEISDSGGFPEQNTESIIGLKQLDPFVSDDGKINCFVKYGTIQYGNEPYFYTRFNNDWFLDFTNLSSDNYYISTDGIDPIITSLYIKASVDNKIYFINTYQGVADPDLQGQWALITLNEQVPIILNDSENFSALKILETLQILLNTSLKEELPKQLNIISKPPESKNFGALNNTSQLNLLNCNKLSLNTGYSNIHNMAVVIPMKSNISSYGPYYYTNIGEDGSGGTKTSRQDILSPWNFFSYQDAMGDTLEDAINRAYEQMNCLGSKLAYEPTKALLRLEKGRATVAGLPVYNLGHNIDNLTNGPTLLTDISVDYGSSGFSTTYNFQTYTPRFGQTEKYILDSWTESIKTNQQINQSLREERSRSSILGKELQKNIGSKNKTTLGNPGPIYSTKSTPNRLLISGYRLNTNGQTLDDSTDFEYPPPTGNVPVQPEDPCNDQPPIDPVTPPSGTNVDRIYSFAETHEAYQALYIQSTYRQLSIMSIDGLYLPVSLRGDRSTYDSNPIVSTGENSGRIARFAMRAENDGSFVEWENSDDLNYHAYAPGMPNPSKTRDEIPPFKIIGVDSTKSYSLPINQQYLNPMLSSTLIGLWDTTEAVQRQNGTTQGFVINSIAFGDNFDQYQLTHNNTPDNEDTDDETIRQEQDNFRFSAMRGPLVLQGWGYDTTGKPIPNMADAPKKAELGKFRKDGLTDKFMKDWIANPRTWPVGPIDLRFDRERGVWVCPSPNKIIVARLKEGLQPYNKAKAELINPEAGGIRFYEHYNISGPNGENVKLSMESTSIVVYDFLGIKLCPNDIIYAYYDDNRYIVLESSRAYKNNPEEECTVQCTTTTTTTPTTPTPCWCDLDCLKTLDGYTEGAKQILGQENGCLKWFDVTECPTSPPAEPLSIQSGNTLPKESLNKLLSSN